MAQIFNPNKLSFHLKQSPVPEFAWYTSANLAEAAKSEDLHFDIRSLDPDKFSFPYHFHDNVEELFVILSGQVTLRTPDGFQVLSEGDIVFFEKGESGAHQLYNHTDQPCRYLDIATKPGLDVCEYPDSGKVNILPRRTVYRKVDQVDYFLEEDQVRQKWPVDIVKK